MCSQFYSDWRANNFNNLLGFSLNSPNNRQIRHLWTTAEHGEQIASDLGHECSEHDRYPFVGNGSHSSCAVHGKLQRRNHLDRIQVKRSSRGAAFDGYVRRR